MFDMKWVWNTRVIQWIKYDWKKPWETVPSIFNASHHRSFYLFSVWHVYFTFILYHTNILLHPSLLFFCQPDLLFFSQRIENALKTDISIPSLINKKDSFTISIYWCAINLYDGSLLLANIHCFFMAHGIEIWNQEFCFSILIQRKAKHLLQILSIVCLLVLVLLVNMNESNYFVASLFEWNSELYSVELYIKIVRFNVSFLMHAE